MESFEVSSEKQSKGRLISCPLNLPLTHRKLVGDDQWQAIFLGHISLPLSNPPFHHLLLSYFFGRCFLRSWRKFI